jgi:hypothetical protein
MAALEARLAMRVGQIPNARTQTPKELAIEVIEEGVSMERGSLSAVASCEGRIPDALGSGADAPWPGMADEASFLADQRGQGIVPPVASVGSANEPNDLSPLPSLEELVQRIPAEARAALDDLFRAKFSGVRRVSKKSLKT